MSRPSITHADERGASTLPTGAEGEGDSAMPSTVGPYRIVERLGEGGMGVVYRALDPRLGREVALKLLRSGQGRRWGETERRRLAREARAMAHLAHPHVVEVFDVGTEGEQVFVAMELVEGPTLGQWLRARERSVEEILEVFVQAGRGLQAAHDKGLVHRDFKPDNVLVGVDGRVRVTDFGLARAAEGSDDEATSSTHDGAPAADEGLPSLTRTGTVMGTPAYMAPEQHYGEPTDARTDQFSFCVALFEALAGRRPFVGHSDAELAQAKHEGPPKELPSGPGLRPEVRRAVLRGLDPKPDLRWPGMAPLLELMAPRSRSRARWIVGGVLVLGVGAGAWLMRPQVPEPRCDGGEERMAEIWSPRRAQAVAEAFRGTALPYAEDTAARVTEALDRQAEQWRQAHREACRAAEVEDPRGASLDARMRCLERRLARVESLVVTLEDADAALVTSATELLGSLESPRECLEADRDEDPIGAPTPEIAARWAEVDDRIAKIEVLLEAQRGKQALALARALHDEVGPDAWPPMRSAVLRALGSALEETDDFEGAEAALTEAYWLAHEHERDRMAALTAAQLVWLYGPRLLRLEAAETWARHARTSMDRAGGLPYLEAMVDTSLAGLNLSLGNADAAEQAYRRVLLSYQQRLGGSHPHLAIAHSNLGAALAAKGDFEGSLEQQRKALDLWEQTLGEAHPERATGLDNVALALARLGRFDEAIEVQEQALALRRMYSDPDQLSIAYSLNNLGAFEEERGNLEAAEQHHRQALARYQRVLEPDDLRLLASQVNLGLALLRQQRHDEARELAERAVLELERSSPEHPYLVYAWVLQGSVAERDGDAGLMRQRGEQAVGRCDEGEVAVPELCLEARYLLARALWLEPSRHDDAIASARAAWRQLDDAPSISTTVRRELEQWLRAHDPQGPVAGG